MKIRKNIVHACLLSTLGIITNAYSGSVNDKLIDLHKRLHNLETAQKSSGINVDIHGVVEVEYGYSEDYNKVDSSDIVLATVELALDASVNDNVDIQISLLHEEDDTPLEVDVGVINLHDEGSPWSLSMGQMYAPFGVFESNMISDPLTLELGESRETTVLVNYQSSGIKAGFYVFNGDLENGADEDKATRFGLSLGYEAEMFTAGIDYISAISDSDGVSGYLVTPVADGGPGVSVLVDQVAGISAHAMVNLDTVSVVFEYVGALDQFDAAEMAFNGVGAEPSAMNLELAVAMPVGGRDSTVAVAYQTTDEAVDMGLPETRTLISFSTEIYESTFLSFEYFRDSDYSVTDGGSDETADTFTIQLATEF